MVFIPKWKSNNKPVIVVELKWDKSAETAITQIKNKKYPDDLNQLSADEKIILVGISYERDDKEGDKRHTCRIEVLRGQNSFHADKCK